MQCQHAQELLSDYVAGLLDQPLVVTLDNHLGQCDNCREETAGLRRVWAELDRMPAVEPPPYFHENLMHRINAELDGQEAAAARRRAVWDWRALLRPRSLAAAACALIVLSAGVGFLHTQSASLGPLSLLAGHPSAPHFALQKPATEWVPTATGGDGGTLIVRLQLENGAAHNGTDAEYTVDIKSAETGAKQSVSGVFLPDGSALARLPLTVHPLAGRETLTVTVRAQKEGAEAHEVWHEPLQIHN